MRLAVVGVGQAGGKVLDRLLEYDRRWGRSFVTSATAVNTARTDLHGLELVPQDRRVLIGQTSTRGHGVGSDNEQAATIAEDDLGEVMDAIDVGSPTTTEAFLVVAGLGGGTGSGAGPVVARALGRAFAEPVYALGLLPSRDEGGLYALNAARSLRTFVREADALFLFDNDAWRQSDETLESGYARMNDELARRFAVLFSAGELVDGTPGEHVVDASEFHNTLAGGGLATVGYAAIEVDRDGRGLLERFRDTSEPVSTTPPEHVASLVRTATRGRLTAPVTVDAADRALLVVSGPPDQLSRRGVETGRRWLEEAVGTTAVRAGDHPVPGQDRIAATVLLAGVTDVPRVRELQARGSDALLDAEERTARHDAALEELLADHGDAIDPLI